MAEAPFRGTPGTSPGAVLALIRSGEAQTRADVARLTGLSRTAVNARVAALRDLGLVLEGDLGPSTGGRPPVQLALDTGAGVVGAVALGRSRVQVGVCDLGGALLGHVEEPLDVTVGPDRVMALVVDRLRAVLTSVGRSPVDLRGIGCSMPGIVDRTAGASTATPLLPSWDGVPLAPYLSELGSPDTVPAVPAVPAVFDNDVLVLALSERDGHLRQHTDLVAVKASTGLGVAVVADGRILHGGRGAAGELGHARSAAADDLPCRCGERGCLETVAAGWALVQAMNDQGRSVGHVRDLVALVRSGDPVARTLVRDAGRRVGEVLATAVTLLNPTAVVIGGDMGPAYDTFAAGLRETLYANATAFATRDLAILESTHGEMAGLVGSGLLALEHVLSPAYVDATIGGRAASDASGQSRPLRS